MQLSLEGRIVKVTYFSEADIWFEAKPLVLYLEYNPSHVSQTLNLVKEKHKKSLKELLDTRGQPKMVELSERSTPGYHERKSLYINEPGLYSLIFRSTKKQAQDFQDWVYEDVLTALRRRGSYALGAQSESFGDLQLALKARDEDLQLALRTRDDALAVSLEDRIARLETALDVALGRRDERILARLSQQCEQLGLRVVFAMQRATTRSLAALLQGLAHTISLQVRGAVRDVIDAAVTGVDSKLVKAFRSATRGPARRSTLDPAQYPADQQADEVQQSLESLSLAEVAHELCPAMTYPGWKAVRGFFGRACLAERKRRGVAKPLLWTFAGGRTTPGGGVRRLYLKSQRELVGAVWSRADRAGRSFHARAEAASRAAPAEPWPVHAADLEPPDFAFGAGN